MRSAGCVIALLVIQYAAAHGADVQCSSCEPPSLTLSTVAQSFFELIKEYEIPPVPDLDADVETLPERPIILEVTVAPEGRPCRVADLGQTDSTTKGVVETLITHIGNWTFTTPRYGETRTCMRARILVYLRNIEGKAAFVFPGLNDPEEPSPPSSP